MVWKGGRLTLEFFYNSIIKTYMYKLIYRDGSCSAKPSMSINCVGLARIVLWSIYISGYSMRSLRYLVSSGDPWRRLCSGMLNESIAVEIRRLGWVTNGPSRVVFRLPLRLQNGELCPPSKPRHPHRQQCFGRCLSHFRGLPCTFRPAFSHPTVST